MSDIVDRLRDIAINAELTQVQQDVLHEAVDTIEQMRKLGIAEVGPSYAEITKDLPKHEYNPHPARTGYYGTPPA